jgi:2-keto-4-pentenoate hydratase/2-oxohepta-3-ene-1,7-dioic acid hydratase in catechol pathway
VCESAQEEHEDHGRFEMKLAMIRGAQGDHPAVALRDGRYLDLGAAARAGILKDCAPSSVTDILDVRRSDGAHVSRLADAVECGAAGVVDPLVQAGAILEADQVSLSAPLRPRLILCTGGAFLDHMKEMGVPPPEYPGAFMKAPHTVSGPRDAILLPINAPAMVDFECEFCCVFDRPCHNVEPEEALGYVAGYTMINDVSSRDTAAEHLGSLTQGMPKRTQDLWDRVILGKQFPGFCPIGPVVVTRDEIPDPHDVHIKTLLNGKVMQSAHTADLVFKLGYTISHFSRWHTFEPGDVLSTGSPAGVGYAHDPKVFLKVGDVVEVEGSGVGSLINRVAAGS